MMKLFAAFGLSLLIVSSVRADSRDCGPVPPGMSFDAQCKLAPPSPPVPMKGLDLFSWKEKGKWHYALLPGTNREKTKAEIMSEKSADLEKLEARLRELPSGTTISWNARAIDGMRFERPAPPTTRKLLERARAHGLEVQP